MGLFDTIVLLDDLEAAACPVGHRLHSLQTKDLDEPSMSTYLVHGGRLYLATPVRGGAIDDEEPHAWRVAGREAVREHRFALAELDQPRTVRAYGHCSSCAPVLVRNEGASMFGDFVREHDLLVDLALTVRTGEPMAVQRTSGTREELQADLRSRGLCVLRDDEPLALAHLELKRARARSPRGLY